jgi:hypothetical protein
MLRDDPEPYLGAVPAVGELVRCTGARAASASRAAFSASLACCAALTLGFARGQPAHARSRFGVTRTPAVKSKIVSYYKELQWFTLAPIPSDTRHTAG